MSASDPSSEPANPQTEAQDLVLIDHPREGVRRLTLNRPEKRNALNRPLRTAILKQLREADADPTVKVMILRGAGKCFSAGYDLSGNPTGDTSLDYSPGGDGSFPREVTEAWMSIWDLAKPVIAQVHGYCLAGGSELATGCDLVYCAHDAQIGYPAVRFGTPDMQYMAWLLGMRRGMEYMLTGDSITGTEAAQLGFATRSFPLENLEEEVLQIAERIALIPGDVLQINKRTIHKAMEQMGLRTSIRAGREMTALTTHADGFKAFIDKVRAGKGLTQALTERDQAFGDYRTSQ